MNYTWWLRTVKETEGNKCSLVLGRYRGLVWRDWGKQRKAYLDIIGLDWYLWTFTLRNMNSTCTRTVLRLPATAMLSSVMVCRRPLRKHETSRELTWLVANVRSVFYPRNATCSPRVYANCTDTMKEVVMRWSVTHSGSFPAGKKSQMFTGWESG